jgi:alkylation response protein AidB-like acyl-CoA dehydrogenase
VRQRADLKFGTPRRRSTSCRASTHGDDFWCQGYSEPGSGSDLASLKTAAERDGDHYVVNGQKIWTTLGHYGDWIFCLVRTDPTRRSAGGHQLPADRHEDARASPCAR